jgi:hypothetical protein
MDVRKTKEIVRRILRAVRNFCASAEDEYRSPVQNTEAQSLHPVHRFRTSCASAGGAMNVISIVVPLAIRPCISRRFRGLGSGRV